MQYAATLHFHLCNNMCVTYCANTCILCAPLRKHIHTHTEGDPSNYLTYFKRAAVYLAIGQSKKALPDLDKTVQLKPDFYQVGVVMGVVLNLIPKWIRRQLMCVTYCSRYALDRAYQVDVVMRNAWSIHLLYFLLMQSFVVHVVVWDLVYTSKAVK